MKINNKIEPLEKGITPLSEKIKEIEKGCRKTIWGTNKYNSTEHYRCGDNKNLCRECEEKLKLLKQFQKEIKEFQEELKEILSGDDFYEVTEIFKNKFGEGK